MPKFCFAQQNAQNKLQKRLINLGHNFITIRSRNFGNDNL